MERIIVGLIDTPSARAALRWAAREAGVTGALIEVVTCVLPPQGYWWCEAPGITSPPIFNATEMRDDVDAMQKRVLLQEFGARLGAIPVRSTIAVAEAADGLIKAATGADLIAVGRPRRGFRFFRRSIGERCSQHFAGPVVLVPEDHAGDGDSEVMQMRFTSDRLVGNEIAVSEGLSSAT
jgi:nucleotide-binding universal stress UspA family protein